MWSRKKRCIIKTAEFELRPIKESDAKSLAHHMSDDELLWYYLSRFKNPVTHWDVIWRKRARSIPENQDLAIVINGKAVGVIELSDLEQGCQCVFGYWIGREFWGKGIMTKAVGLAIDWVFRERKVSSARARVMITNPASGRVLQKNGFELVDREYPTRARQDSESVPLDVYLLRQEEFNRRKEEAR